MVAMATSQCVPSVCTCRKEGRREGRLGSRYSLVEFGRPGEGRRCHGRVGRCQVALCWHGLERESFVKRSGGWSKTHTNCKTWTEGLGCGLDFFFHVKFPATCRFFSFYFGRRVICLFCLLSLGIDSDWRDGELILPLTFSFTSKLYCCCCCCRTQNRAQETSASRSRWPRGKKLKGLCTFYIFRSTFLGVWGWWGEFLLLCKYVCTCVCVCVCMRQGRSGLVTSPKENSASELSG